MDITELKINPAIIEDRIRAVIKSEYPFYKDVKIDFCQINMQDTMSGPHWDSASKDVVGFPIRKIIFKIMCEIDFRTDFEYQNIMKKSA